MDSFITFAMCVLQDGQVVFVDFPDTPMTPVTKITDDERAEQYLESERLSGYVYYNGQWNTDSTGKLHILARLAAENVDVDRVQSIFMKYVHPEDE